MAVSDKPMLTAADLAGAPRFENGVWLMSDQISSEPCPVDTIKPVSHWPACAIWLILSKGQWFAREGDAGIEIRSLAGLITVSGGDMAIVQVQNAVLDDSPPDTAPDPLPYFFLAFDQKPVAGERLSAVDLWLVMCGKFSARERRGEEEAGKEFFTYPGFDKQCRPNSIDVLRAAAAASRTPERQRLQIRWVRAVLD